MKVLLNTRLGLAILDELLNAPGRIRPLDFLPASSLTPRNFLAFNHPDITVLKRRDD